MTTFGEKTVRGNFTCGGILGGIDGGGTFGGGTPGGGMPIFGGGTELDGGATVGIFGGMIGGGSEIVDDSISFLISSRKKSKNREKNSKKKNRKFTFSTNHATLLFDNVPGSFVHFDFSISKN